MNQAQRLPSGNVAVFLTNSSRRPRMSSFGSFSIVAAKESSALKTARDGNNGSTRSMFPKQLGQAFPVMGGNGVTQENKIKISLMEYGHCFFPGAFRNHRVAAAWRT